MAYLHYVHRSLSLNRRNLPSVEAKSCDYGMAFTLRLACPRKMAEQSRLMTVRCRNQQTRGNHFQATWSPSAIAGRPNKFQQRRWRRLSTMRALAAREYLPTRSICCRCVVNLMIVVELMISAKAVVDVDSASTTPPSSAVFAYFSGGNRFGMNSASTASHSSVEFACR